MEKREFDHFDMDLEGDDFLAEVRWLSELPLGDLVSEVKGNEALRGYLGETCAQSYRKDAAWYADSKDVEPCFRCHDFRDWDNEQLRMFVEEKHEGIIGQWAPIIVKTLLARMMQPSEVEYRKKLAREADIAKQHEMKLRRDKDWQEFLHIVPRLYRNASVKDFSDGARKSIITPILETGLSCILYGGNGVGKTHLAWALFREFRYEGTTSWLSTLSALLSDISTKAITYKRSAIDIIEASMVRQLQVLLIDECDKTDIEGSAFKNFSHLINRRYEEGLQTVLLCNAIDKEELKRKLGDSIVSRFSSDAWVAKVIPLLGDDKRQKRTAQG